MRRLKKYDRFLIQEKYDKNLKAKLIEMGITDENELKKQIHLAKRGFLGQYLEEKGDTFTFGILKAIFKDAIKAKHQTEIKRGIFRALPSAIPLAFAPFFPILAVIGSIFGSSRTVYKVLSPIFDYLSPESKYSDFLKKMIDSYMKIPEGEIKLKDRFTRAFVVSDRLIDAIKPDVLDKFSKSLAGKMEFFSDNDPVPPYFIENELKSYLNINFDVSPEIPLKEVY